jgi:CIC family chloride channel protein
METDKSHRKARLSNILDKLRSNEIVFGLILTVVVGVAAGFGAVLFWKMIEICSWFFFKGGAVAFEPLGKYYVIIIPALGGLIFAPIIYYLAREAKGEGPPDVMEAIAVKGGGIRARVLAVKVLVSSICIGSGGSVGREGPIVQIGASVGSTIGRWLKLSDEWLKTLVLCGAAGGISATFNAPLAGIVFALEVIAGRFISPRFGYIVISSVSANVIARIFLFTEEHPTSFIVPQYSIVSYWEMLPYALLGVVIAFVALGFIRFFYKTEDLIAKLKIPEYLKPAVAGIIIGLIGSYYPQVFGVGYGTHYGVGGVLVETGAVEQALAGEVALVTIASILILKIVATSLTLGSGGSGGIFAPSLFIGAMLGGAFGIGVHNLFPTITASSGAYALVGMGAFFAVVVRGPITAIIILFEITRDYALILPLMTAVVISSIIARQFALESIYTLRLLRRGVDIRQLEETRPMREVTVAEAMTPNFPTVLPTMPIGELVTKLRKSGHHGFPVVDKGGNFCGVVTLSDVEAAMSKGSYTDLTVADIASQSLIVAYPDQYLHDVFVKLGARDIGRIPVVDRSNPKHLLGVLRRHDIIRAYTKAITRKPVRKEGGS